MAIPAKVYTVDDLWEMQREEDHRYELIEGELVRMSPTGEEHGTMISELTFLVMVFVKEHDLGRVTAAETGYTLWKNPAGKDTVLAPDVGFISKDRMSPTPNKRYVDGAPDLAVEVMSPSDNLNAMDKKARIYLKYGTRLIWIFDLKNKKVYQYRSSTDEPETFGINDVLDGRDVLPGFKLTLKDIFGD